MNIEKDIPEIVSDNLLILTASGGGGLLTAAKAKEQEAMIKNPNTKVYTKDLMALSHVGRFGVRLYNTLQRRGKVSLLVKLANLQFYFESIFWFHTFWIVSKALFINKVDHIIDTQPLVTTAIIKALRLYNRVYKKNVMLEKIIVDYPTKYCSHFFKNIKRLPSRYKKHIFFVSLFPLLEKGETEEEFWEKHCSVSTSNITYDTYPMRLAFNKYKNVTRDEKKPFSIFIRTKNEKEKALTRKAFYKGSLNVDENVEGFNFEIAPKDKLVTILLGAQPAFLGTFNYFLNFVNTVKKLPSDKNYVLIVYCDGSSMKKKNLFETISNYVQNSLDFPANASIFPISYQQDDALASIFFRSDVTITRSGGQTGIEIMSVGTGDHFIHAEVEFDENNPPEEMDLLKGIPAWEGGNALLIKERIGSRFIIPEYFEKETFDILKNPFINT
jgi:hypothetical protein